MKKIILSIGIAACTLIAANAQDIKTEKQPVLKATPATKVNTPTTKLSTATSHQHQHQQPHQQPQPVSQNPNAPDIAFESNVIDYGKIEYNGDGLRLFKFKNKGKEPLIITNAKGSCGCTVPTWPREPIMPGKSGVIKVKYATNRVGRFTKTVTISSNAKIPTTRLTIKGEVGPKPVAPTEQTVPVKKVIEGATPVENH